MASGNSRRFGKNKLLEEINGKKLYLYGLEKLALIKDKHCKVIIVSQYSEILSAAENMGFTAVYSPDSIYGASYTVKNGIKSIENITQEDYLIFMVADQPYLSLNSIEKLLSAAETGADIARLYCGEIPGNPVLFSAKYVPELLNLSGDQGGGALVKKYGCSKVEIGDIKELSDIDTAEDLQNAAQ